MYPFFKETFKRIRTGAPTLTYPHKFSLLTDDIVNSSIAIIKTYIPILHIKF